MSKQLEAEGKNAVNNLGRPWMAVCMGTGCMSSASAELRQALREELDKHSLGEQVEVRRTGCFGFCEQGPIVVVHPGEIFYTQVKPRDVKAIVEEHILDGRWVERLLVQWRLHSWSDLPREHGFPRVRGFPAQSFLS